MLFQPHHRRLREKHANKVEADQLIKIKDRIVLGDIDIVGYPDDFIFILIFMVNIKIKSEKNVQKNF